MTYLLNFAARIGVPIIVMLTCSAYMAGAGTSAQRLEQARVKDARDIYRIHDAWCVKHKARVCK